jgi:hypothetical protein
LRTRVDLDHHLGHVRGTVLLNEKAAHTEILTGGLKNGTRKDRNIVLAPQPSEDPNDPLNWSKAKKEINLLILAFGATLHASVPVWPAGRLFGG